MADETDPIDRGREMLLRALREGDVRFVVIGGAALQSHGQPEGYTQLIAGAEQRRVAATTITVAVASLADVEHRARALAYDLGLEAIDEEITALEQSNGGPLTTKQR
jgi:hypothetical protein